MIMYVFVIIHDNYSTLKKLIFVMLCQPYYIVNHFCDPPTILNPSYAMGLLFSLYLYFQVKIYLPF